MYFVWLVMMCFFPSMVYAGPPVQEGMPPPVVSVVTVELQDINPAREYVGHVQAIQTVVLQPRARGYVEEVRFKDGEYVHKGDILYVIEQDPYKAEIEADMARLAQAEAELFKAQQHLERLRAARPESVPATDMDNAIAERDAADARVKEAKAVLRLARINLGYTLIHAPINGRIGQNFFTIGNLVGPDSGPLARIVQMDPIRVLYPVSENDIAEIQTALKKNIRKSSLLVPDIRLPDGSLYPMDGKVEFVDNRVDRKTGTISVWAVFPNPDGILIPGMYVTVLVRKGAPRMIPVVPQSAVQEDKQGRYVLVIDKDNRVSIRHIRTGLMVGTAWTVEKGLAPGDSVIVDGILKVRPGQRVTVKKDSK